MYAVAMAAEHAEVTPNHDESTDRNLLEHLLEDVHEILRTLQVFATPEAKAMLDGLLSNPALKWKARRNGGSGSQ